jgi:hypothetical protein
MAGDQEGRHLMRPKKEHFVIHGSTASCVICATEAGCAFNSPNEEEITGADPDYVECYKVLGRFIFVLT